MSTIQHKYIVTSGILIVDPGFKALNWHSDIDTMFSIGIIHLLTWFAATQNPYIVALIADEDIEHTMDTLVGKHELTVRGRESMVHVSIYCATSSEEVKTLAFLRAYIPQAFKNYQEIQFGLVGLIIDRSAKPRLTTLSQTNCCKAFSGIVGWVDLVGNIKKLKGGSDFMDTSPTSPTCIAQLSHAATPLPADDGMDGMDVNKLPMPGTRDTDKAHEDTVDKLPASPTHAPTLHLRMMECTSMNPQYLDLGMWARLMTLR
ncbi:hypothetical protein BS47DRAFT_1398726 [Hydnum rufescens UP504]|uniref:Uncharacterized protein n=1 Tax=Hydnum rufescens UP504 TaxID=1448309 RepID=A0A9P6DQF0_9AGAM|nr:hypothetical protein BS47DRAFT_1398726 [Hydnum rufescens UP504]